MNIPTKTATPANTSKKMLKNRRPCLMSFWFSLVICSPVSTSTSGGTTLVMDAASCS